MSSIYHVVYFLTSCFGWTARVWGRWRIRGAENVPTKGPLLVVANHVSQMDVPLLALSIGRKSTFMAKEELFSNGPQSFIFGRCLNSFPVNRDITDFKAIRKAKEVLSQNRVLVMFPEGTRSKGAQLQEAMSGAALIALHSKAPILPVGISGTEQIKNFFSIFRRPVVIINIGKPFSLPDDNGSLTKNRRTELTNVIMGQIAELLPEQYRGSYKQNGN